MKNKKYMHEIWQKLMEVRENAYAPYSHFKVAAMIIDDQGNMSYGVNVENAAYPLGTCAEAGAIAAMQLAKAQSIAEIYIIGSKLEQMHALCMPCGGCRQKIAEFATSNTKIICANFDGSIHKTFTMHELLPHNFTL